MAPWETEEGYDLRLRPDDGSRYLATRTMDQDMDMTVMNRSMNMKQKQTITLRYDVTSTADRGGMDLDYTATRFQGETSIPAMGQNIVYDTADSTATGRAAQMGQRMRAMTGHTLTAQLAPKGSVRAVTGVKALLDSMSAVSSNPRQVEFMRQMLGPEKVKQQLSLSFEIYPDAPVSVGDSWSRQSTVRMGFPVRAEATYTLDSIKAKRAVLDAHMDLRPTEGDDPMRMGGMQINMDLSGTVDGTIHVDLPTGLPVKQNLNVDLSGTGEMQRSGGLGGERSIQMELQSTGTVTETIREWDAE